MDHSLPHEFWAYLERLVAEHPIVIDRPRGSAHPAFPTLIYPLDYGYLDGTTAIDGGGVDLWLGSLPERTLDALAITVDLHKSDVEIKLLLGCSAEEQQTILNFLNGASMRATLVQRHPGQHLLRTRRSVRRFLPNPISPETLQRILETAGFAPSAHNRQPWRFAVVATPAARQRLAEALSAEFRQSLLADLLPPSPAIGRGAWGEGLPSPPERGAGGEGLPSPPGRGAGGEGIDARVERSRQRLLNAPAAILLCLDPTDGDHYPDLARQQAEHIMGVQSAALAGGTLLLAAHAEGLAGVWLCAPLFAPQAARLALDLPAAWEPQALLLLGYPARTPPPRPRRPLSETTIFL